MCKRASFLAVRGGKVAWLLTSDSHEGIIKAEGLKDNDEYNRQFVRIECLPKDDPFSINPLDWEVKEDEESLPSWYDREEWVGKILSELIEVRIPTELREKKCGDLDLRGTGITSLPEGLTVGGNLYLRGTGITSLPEGLTVGGDLYLEGCMVSRRFPMG